MKINNNILKMENLEIYKIKDSNIFYKKKITFVFKNIKDNKNKYIIKDNNKYSKINLINIYNMENSSYQPNIVISDYLTFRQINSSNIHKYIYLNQEIKQYLSNKKLNINEVFIYLKFDPKSYNKILHEKQNQISFLESCIYNFSIDLDGYIVLTSNNTAKLFMIYDNKYYSFRCVENHNNYNLDSFYEKEISKEEFLSENNNIEINH
jgi:hypothetical protein